MLSPTDCVSPAVNDRFLTLKLIVSVVIIIVTVKESYLIRCHCTYTAFFPGAFVIVVHALLYYVGTASTSICRACVPYTHIKVVEVSSLLKKGQKPKSMFKPVVLGLGSIVIASFKNLKD